MEEEAGGNAMALSVESSDNEVFMDALFGLSQSRNSFNLILGQWTGNNLPKICVLLVLKDK